MNIADGLSRIAARIPEQCEILETEEATKNALVMPFINALGFNVFDPTEVIPEYTADVGVKKGEKVDYVVVVDGHPMVLIECKACGTALDLKHASQLFRYFTSTEARFAVLTNGVDYQFYTDLDAPNKMDARPFFDFRMTELSDGIIEEISKFTKQAFDLDNILSNATELKHTKQLGREIERIYEEPDEEFVRLLIGRVHSGMITAGVRDQFRPLIRKAFRDFVRDEVKSRLQTALNGAEVTGLDRAAEPDDAASIDEAIAADDGIETTDDEMQAYHIVRAIVSQAIPLSRVAIRDTKSYCGILLDDNNRKPICRLHFNGSQLYLGLFDADRTHTRHKIDCVSDIHQFADELIATVQCYDGAFESQETPASVDPPASESADGGPSIEPSAEPSAASPVATTDDMPTIRLAAS